MPPQPNDQDSQQSIPLDQSHTLLTSFSSLLTISIHNILYYRQIYPPQTFLSTRAYNLPVHQSRHPKVCTWITDAVSAVSAQLATGHVSLIAVVIHSPFSSSSSSSSYKPPAYKNPPQKDPNYDSSSSLSSFTPNPYQQQPPRAMLPGGTVLERYVFDVFRFPAWPSAPNRKTRAEAMRTHGTKILARDMRNEKSRDEYLDSFFGPLADGERNAINFADLDEQFRACLRRMAAAMESLGPLPEGCGFTVAVELKKEGEAPIGHPQEWIPSQPNLQPAAAAASGPSSSPSSSSLKGGADLGGVKTTAVRAVEAGPLFFECWVEEGEAKETFLRQQKEAGSQDTVRS